ncbi:MAG: alpha-N-arabinofuranosidase [Bacteroidetes bacterium]|nr:alpha-N-arabinofuranosidase [Bacteroidota bacterium]
MRLILSSKFLLAALCCLSIYFNATAQSTVNIQVQGANPKTVISRHIYGHFSEHLGRCIYDGFWVKDSANIPKKDRIRLDIVAALKKIQIPNLRWPGGCFADEYHWRDGIGVRDQRPKMVNTNWGNVTEDNSFGTHEFLELCSLLNCEPYITGNVGSGTIEEMSKWVEYLNFDGLSPMTQIRKQNGREKPWQVHFWGVGNESWGCGGNMTADYYADQYKRYAGFTKDYPGVRLMKIASGANSGDYNWTETMMKKVDPWMMWGLTLHYYTVPKDWGNKGSATSFDEAEYFTTMKKCLVMEELVSKHSTIMDQYDPTKKVALVVDEWGIWTNVEPGTNPGFLFQQNSLRDALVAATTLNIFNNHADRVRVANLAQTINVLQALILTEGNKMLLTPTYHVFDLFKTHQDAKLLPVQFVSPDFKNGKEKIPALNMSASIDSNAVVHMTIVNLDPTNAINIRTALQTIKWTKVEGEILTSAKITDINSFDKPENVKPKTFDGAKKQGDDLVLSLPAQSIVLLTIK